MKLLLFAHLLMALHGADSTEFTRGIGVYPGAPSEYFAPSVSWTDNGGQLSNVALHRAAYASSACDYNHTAHLVTDGLCDAGQPVTLNVSTPAGRLARRESEWAIDGGPFSRNILMGSRTWLQFEWGGDDRALSATLCTANQVRLQGMVAYDDQKATQGYLISIQQSADGTNWQTIGRLKGDGLPGQPLHYKLHSDPNKQEAQEYLPARRLDEVIQLENAPAASRLRVCMEMEGAAHWDVHELQLLDGNRQPLELLPSRQFSSMWMSNGGGEQWIYADLGTVLPLEELRLSWYLPPAKGQVEVSDDGRQWRAMADLPSVDTTPNVQQTLALQTSARYVRLLLHQTGSAGCYALREMEVMSKKRIVYTPHPTPAVHQPALGIQQLSGGNWVLQRASEVKAKGEDIASSSFSHPGWIPATVPGTVLASYLNIGAIPNPNYGDDVDQISESFFRSNFWYRNEFEVSRQLLERPQQWLHFDGINWKANVFLNGQLLGRIEGAFMRGRFNVTGLLREGTNYLAVEVVCNDHFAAIKEKDTNTTQFNGGLLGADNPTFHATVGWDWITTVRGREAGIWNEVYLSATELVTLSDPYVETHCEADGKTVRVSPSVFVRNNDVRTAKGVLRGWIGNVQFEKPVVVPAGSEQQVSFCPDEFPQLSDEHFRLWWPNGYGEPYLYDAGFSFSPDGNASANTTARTPRSSSPSPLTYKAGLREMKYVAATDSLRIYVNGRRFIPLGGNWGFDEHNLLYRSREYDVAVGYHRDMNFTMIRNWVGQVGDEAFYEACDRHGIMVWQDFWLANPADGPDPYDERMFLSNAEDYVRRIRSHASIGLYCGRNEGFPPETLDRKLREYVHTLSPGIEYISHSSSQGVSGGGPYRALPMKEYFSRQSGKIHSERGMPNVMNIESLRRTFSEESLWPQSLQWGQHDFTLQGAQRASEFNALMDRGFGPSQSAEEFSRRAQLINYNGYRGMFESTSRSRAGLLLWMSHPCWPSMVWQTYDYYFEPTAAYFGAKKACEPLHIQYNALTDSIEVVNHSAGQRKGVTATATIFNMDGKQVKRLTKRMDSPEDTTQPWTKLSRLVAAAPSDVYFLRLQLTDKKGVISENLYILGRNEGDYRALNNRTKAQVHQQVSINSAGDTQTATVMLSNTSDVPAVFLRLNLKGTPRGMASGGIQTDNRQILPATYSDNYITLMPGETTTVTISWKLQDAHGMQPYVEITEL